MSSNITHKIDRSTSIKIYNILRMLGLKSSLIGTNLINKAVQILLTYGDIDSFNLHEIYNQIALSSDGRLDVFEIREYIRYAIVNRNTTEKIKQNFEKIFGYEYDESVFDNGSKNFIAELTHVISL